MIQNIQKNYNQQNKVLIGFAGDTMLGRLVNQKISATSYHYPWGNVLPLLKKTDLNIINLETTLTISDKKVSKVFNFKADPDKVKTLQEGRIDVVTIANNHILDYDEEGLLETIQILDKTGIKRVGAGKNAKEAIKPAIVIVKGGTIGILGYTDNEPGWKAASQPGTNYIKIGDINTVKNDVEQIKNKVDVLIVSIHWGPNMQENPSEQFITFAHQMIDIGVNIIHGHSAHIFQGIELYKNGLILYDTGDFVDDYAVDPYLRNDRTFLFLCEVGKQGVKGLRLLPLLIDRMQVNLAKGTDYDRCIERMQRLSAVFGTDISKSGEVSMN